MKGKKKYVFIISIIIVIIVFSLMYNLFRNKNERIAINNISVNYDKQINVCKEDSGCSLLPSDNYPIINVDTNSKMINKLVNRYNKDVNTLYDKVNNSNLDGNECANVRDMYKYRYTTSIYYYTYYDDKVVSISRDVYVKDLCLDELTQDDYDINVYDINTSKKLSNEDILKMYNLTEDDIRTKINESININNDISLEKISIDDIYKDGKLNYNIYFDQDGYMNIKYISSKNNRTYSVMMMKIEE